jgi:hypothetical protein
MHQGEQLDLSTLEGFEVGEVNIASVDKLIATLSELSDVEKIPFIAEINEKVQILRNLQNDGITSAEIMGAIATLTTLREQAEAVK